MRDIVRGKWISIQDEAQFDAFLNCCESKCIIVRVKKGDYVGPGRYLALSYSQPCPRGCCQDNVRELLSDIAANREIDLLITDLNMIRDVGQ